MTATLLYDGDCGFCARSAGWIAALSSPVSLVPWQRYDLDSIPLTPERADQMLHLVEDGRLWAGHDAVGEALRRSPRRPVRLVGRVLGVRVLRPLWTRIYATVAANRHRLPGGTAACALPSRDD